jgi:LysM repeat protein
MGRYGRRISRSLIGVLIVTLVLGLVFYLKNTSKTRAQEAKAQTGASSVNAGALPPVEKVTHTSETPPPKVNTTSTPPPTPAPTTKPATQPTVAMTFTPTTPTAQTTPTTRPSSVSLMPNSNGAAPAPGSAATVTTSKNPLTDAQARKDGADLLGARRILNDALLSGRLSASEIDAAKKQIAEINQVVVFSPKRFADDEFGGTYSVQSGDRLTKIAEKHEIPWQFLLRLNGMSDPKKLRAGQTLKVVHGPFNLVVSKSKFSMDIYLGAPGEKGSMYITSFPVGLGKDDSTPTGTWMVEAGKKIANPTYFSPRGEGVTDADDPKNPLGERWIGLTGIDGHAIGKSSYGIHGTVDESSIGKQESMGCIRMHNADVEVVFDMVVDGKSTVIVKD